MKKKNEVKVLRYWNTEHTKCREIVYDPGAAKRMKRFEFGDRLFENLVLVGMIALAAGLYILGYNLIWG